MRAVALFFCLLIHVWPLHSQRQGKEMCYQILKVRTSYLDCSRLSQPIDSNSTRFKREISWGVRNREPLPKQTTTQPATEPPTTTAPSKCKIVWKRKFVRVPIHERPIDPELYAFQSPNFPDMPTNKIKCEWDVTGVQGKQYYVDILKQYLNPSSGGMANCLWIKGKGNMCSGNVVPVLTRSNRLFMKMTIDSNEIHVIEGGLKGFYLEYNPTEPDGGLPVASQTVHGNWTCNSNSTQKAVDLRQQLNRGHIVTACKALQTRQKRLARYRRGWPVPAGRRTTTTKTRTDYKKDSAFIDSLFKSFPVRRPTTVSPTSNRYSSPAATTQAPTSHGFTMNPSASTRTDYQEEDVCHMEPPEAANSTDPSCNTTQRYFYNASSGECQEISINVDRLSSGVKGNNFQVLTTCQRTCMNVCMLPKDEGYGNSHHTRFYYKDGSCRSFQYKGKGGNANNFADKLKCGCQCEAERVRPDPSILEAIRNIINDPAMADEYEDNSKMKCLLPHLTSSATPAPTESQQ